MLILSRRCGEAIIIGNDIEIKLLSTSGNQVRLGITAPKGLSVHREEIKRKIEETKMSDETLKPM